MRIGINVPNDLLKRIKTLQPDMNISQVCREAIEQVAERHERAVERILEFANSDKRTPLDPDWVGYALDDARVWARTMTPED